MKLKFLKPDAVKPSGWVATQLEVLSQGVFTALPAEVNGIGKSAWLGGAYDKSGELFPLWLDGYIYLAYVTGNKAMQEKAENCIKKVLGRQHGDGWLSTAENNEKADLYQTFLMMKALITFHKITDDKSTEQALLNAARAVDLHTDIYALTKNAHARIDVAKECIEYLCEICEEDFIPQLLKKLECQAFAWAEYEISIDRPSIWSDGCNNIIALRSQQLSAQKETEEKFGLPSGAIAADAMLTRPTAVCGADLPSVCEYMQTLFSLLQKTAEPWLADKAEKLLFNAFFGAINPTMTAIEYTQRLNQTQARATDKTFFTTRKGDASVYGYTAQDGLAAAQFGRVLPAFVSSAVMKTENGFAVVSYIPTKTTVTHNGQPVTIEVVSEYPFRETVKVVVTCNEPTAFTLSLRIPEWVDEAKISTGASPIYPLKNAFYDFSGVWSDTTEFTLQLSSDFKLERQSNDLFTLSKGILLFAMPLDEKKKYISGTADTKLSEYELYADSKWSYGLFISNKDAISKEISFEEKPVAHLPFSTLTPPLEAYIYGKEVEWQQQNGEPVAKPFAVAASNKKEMLRFLPYGCTNLRMTALPKA